jgi:uncharacterized integral membrane protein
MFRWAVLIVCLLAAVAGLSIGVLNPDSVAVVLPGWSFELPLGSLLMATFALGLICGLLLYLIFFRLPNRLSRGRQSSVTRKDPPRQNA